MEILEGIQDLLFLTHFIFSMKAVGYFCIIARQGYPYSAVLDVVFPDLCVHIFRLHFPVGFVALLLCPYNYKKSCITGRQ